MSKVTPTLKAYSYANYNISEDIVNYQKRVFNKLQLPIEQIISNTTHGEFLSEIAKKGDSKYIILFDVDCIPLTSNIYDIILTELETEQCIIGIEQMCGCNPHNHLYAGPACLAFSTELYESLGYPSLAQNGNRSDVGEELTWLCEENNINVKFFKVTSSEIPKWKLTDNREFGIGTTYNHNNIDVLYHQFEIRKGSDNFIAKCKSILN